MNKSISSKFSIFAVILIAAITLGLSSCTNNDPISTNPGNNSPVIPEYVSAGTQVDDLQISEATMDNPAKLQNDMEPERLQRGMQFCQREPQFRFRPIFQNLNLTQTQLDSIKVFMQEQNDCQRIARAEFYNTIIVFIDRANTQRQAVIDSAKQGLLDRQSAMQRFVQINREMHLAIANSGAQQTLRTALQACTETLFANIRSILTTEQLVKWDTWVANHNGPNPRRGRG
jgi:hypothetical protein